MGSVEGLGMGRKANRTPLFIQRCWHLKGVPFSPTFLAVRGNLQETGALFSGTSKSSKARLPGLKQSHLWAVLDK